MSEQIASPDDLLRYELLKELEKIQKENDNLKKDMKLLKLLSIDEQLAESRKFPPKDAGMTPNEQLIEYKKFGRPIQFPQFYLYTFKRSSTEPFITFYGIEENNHLERNSIYILIYDILWQIVHNRNVHRIGWTIGGCCPFNINTIKDQLMEVFPSLNLRMEVIYTHRLEKPISFDIKWDPIRQI